MQRPLTFRLLTKMAKQNGSNLKQNLIKWDNKPYVLTFMTDIDTRKIFEEELRQLIINLEERVKNRT